MLAKQEKKRKKKKKKRKKKKKKEKKRALYSPFHGPRTRTLDSIGLYTCIVDISYYPHAHRRRRPSLGPIDPLPSRRRSG
jgi:hypothetical protein